MLKYNKIIVKMHKRDPQIWKELRQDEGEQYQNQSLQEGCIRMIEVLKQQGDENLQKHIRNAEKSARDFKY